jgi:hypothetical protein
MVFAKSHNPFSMRINVTLAFQGMKLDAPSNLSSNLKPVAAISKSEF